MNRNRQILTVFLVALAVLISAVEILRNPQGPLPALSPALTVQAEKHILYGDDRGGGHLHGTGRACKSEFPAEWEPEEVIAQVKKVAANDNLDWEQQQNGYYVAEQMVEGVRVRVVLNRDQKKIVTAYPTNVERNPCPADARKVPANDP